MKPHSLQSFYTKFAAGIDDATGLASQLREVGHFNVFNIANLAPYTGGERPMLFDRRLYYK
ncbi:MAG: AraC family transcriptional regulator, partial [Cytophagaceae bacterium]